MGHCVQRVLMTWVDSFVTPVRLCMVRGDPGEKRVLRPSGKWKVRLERDDPDLLNW